MHNIEWIDWDDDFWEISEELWNLKEEVNENFDIESAAKTYWVPYEVTKEYINILKDFYAPNKISKGLMDGKLINKIWLDIWEYNMSNTDWIIFYYIKKLCPNKYKDVLPLTASMLGNEWSYLTPWRLNIKYWSANPNEKIKSSNNIIKDVLLYIKKFWDNAYNVLKFCSPFDWSYIKSSLSQYTFKSKSDISEWNTTVDEWRAREVGSRSMLTMFFENFIYEPESLNLLYFLKENPQKLDNLWGKEVKSIELSIDSWINFAFRWIIEMVKSRPDIDFPHLNNNANESEKKLWEESWEKIMREYENMLRNYISKDFINGWRERNNKQAFDKIFYTTSIWDEVFDDAMIPERWWIQEFSWNKISDYSFNVDENSGEHQFQTSKKMLSDIEKYVKEHPDEKILICIEQHGNPDWSSWNWWSKEDWLRLADLSENIKIWSIRCYFWTAFDNKDIYNHKASVSWYSNLSTASAYASEAISMALKKWLWFHEMEIFTRLNYPISVSPLTESMEYTNRNTWETETWKVWLAQNDGWYDHNIDNNYA